MTLTEPSGQHAQRIADVIAKWSPGGAAHALNEEQGAQQHFIELCTVLGVAPPSGDDDYLFEKGTLLLGQRRGYADVFKRGCFGWENKAPGKPLDAALRPLMIYALALDNPPLLIVSDRPRIEIHTHFNGTPSERHVVTLAQLADPARRELLRRASRRPTASSRHAPTGRSPKRRPTPLPPTPSGCARPPWLACTIEVIRTRGHRLDLGHLPFHRNGSAPC